MFLVGVVGHLIMRCVVTTKNGGTEVLQVQERPDPLPGAGEAVVAVKAAGLNFADILARQGLYPDGPRKPCVMGYEVSGVVESVGEGVDRAIVGLPVVAMTRFDGQSEKVVVGSVSYLKSRNPSVLNKRLRFRLTT